MNKILIILGGGIGNIIQATPALNLIDKYYEADLILDCDSLNSMNSLFKFNKIKIIKDTNKKYDIQLIGPLTNFKKVAKKTIRPRVSIFQRKPEYLAYVDMARQLKIYDKPDYCSVAVENLSGNKYKDHVAIFCGSKSNWPIKRWDKYDELSRCFKKVILVGTKKDIETHGENPWIKKKWNWPSHVDFFYGSLLETAKVIKQCKMFIGNDGGISHLSSALKIPTFIIFGPTCDTKNKPYAKDSYVINKKLECQPCQFNSNKVFIPYNNTCPRKIECMRELSTKEVIDSINLFLDESYKNLQQNPE